MNMYAPAITKAATICLEFETWVRSLHIIKQYGGKTSRHLPLPDPAVTRESCALSTIFLCMLEIWRGGNSEETTTLF